MNSDIGTIECPFTKKTVPVRKAKSGRFPLYIVSPFSPQLFMKTQAGQDWILERMTALSATERKEAEGDRPGQRTPEPEKTPAPQPEEKRGSVWDDLI